MIFNEISKNLKQIFRNWSSLILLILGPLALILIIGFTSAGETAHGVQIGITADNYSSIKDLTNKIEKIGNLEKYEDINECIDNLKNNKKHLCIEVEQELTEDQTIFPRGIFTFYYDESRKKLSDSIITEINKIIGETSEDISIKSTTGILDEIQKLVL